METCKVDGCEGRHEAKGYCQKHYTRFWKHDDPLHIIEITIGCKVEGCENKHAGLGYCAKHYARFKRLGDPLSLKTRREAEMHGMGKISEYRTLASMKDRCYRSKNKYYHRYGGRGITVCERWRNSFIAFLEDMGLKPFPEAQIDRIDNDLGYFKENCRWATPEENSRNSVHTKLTMRKAEEIRKQYNAGGVTQREVGIIFGVKPTIIHDIVNNQKWV